MLQPDLRRVAGTTRSEHVNISVYFCSMISKSRLKELCRYKAQEQCEADGLYVVEGDKMCVEALRGWQPVQVICATQEWLRRHEKEISTFPSEVYDVSRGELERVSAMRTPHDVWMLLRRPEEPTMPDRGPLLVVDGVQAPGNMGTIIRVADWFGLRDVVCSRDTASPFNAKVVQATMGGIFRTRVVRVDLPSFLSAWRSEGRPVYGAVLNGKSVYEPWDRQIDAALVIGNESRGIRPEVAACLTHSISIPNRGGTCESLNAATAAAILCAEWLRP